MRLQKDAIKKAITILKEANESDVSTALYALITEPYNANLEEINLIDTNQYVFATTISWQDIALEIESMEGYPTSAKLEHINGVIDYLSENYLPEDITEDNKDTILEKAVNNYFAEEEAKAREAEEEYRQNMGPFRIY